MQVGFFQKALWAIEAGAYLPARAAQMRGQPASAG
jgi:hypothetical protein